MCLDSKWTKARTKEWLGQHKGDDVIAYKIVRSYKVWGNDGQQVPIMRLSPSHQTYGRNGQVRKFKRRNLVREVGENDRTKTFTIRYTKKDTVITGTRKAEYVAYYHLYAEQSDAFEKRGSGQVMTCRIPKKFITDIGVQSGKVVIITRCFEFAGVSDELFDKPKVKKSRERKRK